MDRVFVDTDVIMDLLDQRQPYYIGAAQLFSLADRKKIKALVSALSFTNVHYVLRKKYTSGESKKILIRFKVLVNVLQVEDKIVELA